MSETTLITGASRGIGLALTSTLLDEGGNVIACCRRPDDSLELLALKARYARTLTLVSMDVSSEESVAAAARSVSRLVSHIDVLVNMAAVRPEPQLITLERIDVNQFREAFEINSLGPLRVSMAFMPLLRHSERPRLINVSSGAGAMGGSRSQLFTLIRQLRSRLRLSYQRARRDRISFTEETNPQDYSYATSKAALNMITRKIAADFWGLGVVVVALDPGWVRTDMGGPNAPLSAKESAAAIARTMRSISMRHSSQFIYNNGTRITW